MAIPLPDICVSQSTTVTPEYGMVQDYTDDGEMYVRNLYSKTRYKLNLVWEDISTADILSLENFIETYRLVDVEIPIGTETYTGKLVTDTVSRTYSGGLLSGLTATYRGTKNG